MQIKALNPPSEENILNSSDLKSKSIHFSIATGHAIIRWNITHFYILICQGYSTENYCQTDGEQKAVPEFNCQIAAVLLRTG